MNYNQSNMPTGACTRFHNTNRNLRCIAGLRPAVSLWCIAAATRPVIHITKHVRATRRLVFFWQNPATIVCVNAAVSKRLAGIQQSSVFSFGLFPNLKQTGKRVCHDAIQPIAEDCNSFFEILSAMFHLFHDYLVSLFIYTFAFVISTL